MPGLRPFVLIGAGGSGGKTVRVVREALRQKLIQVDWHGEWPAAWQLLHIDVPVIPDGVTEDLPYQLGAAQYMNLAERNGTYAFVDGAVTHPGGDPGPRHLGLDCWQPWTPADVGRQVQITLGAGQYRAVGRMALLSRLSDAAKRVNRAIDDARAADTGVLDDIKRRMFGADADDLGDARPFVIVTGSLAGGSGSGTLLDICDIVRASSHVTGVQEVLAVLYTPELFQDQNGDYDPGVAPNTFMAINEIANSMVTAGARELPPGRAFVFGRAGLTPNPHAGLGPTAAILVGRQNASISLGAAAEIYHVMGGALANLVSDPTLQEGLIAYGLGNAAQQSHGQVNHNPLVTEESTHTADFMAMGFARVTIGLEYFNRYAAERLARMALERLLDQHLTLARPDRLLNDEELLRASVEQAWPKFLRESKCSEVGVGADGLPNNDIVEALWPPTADSLFAEWASTALAQTLAKMGGDRMSPEEVRRTVEGILSRDRSSTGTTVSKQFEDSLHATARTWVQEMHGVLEVLAVRAAVDYGLPTTSLLFQRLSDHLRTARTELTSEAQQLRQQVKEATAVFSTRSATDPHRVQAEPEAVRPFAEEAAKYLKGHNRAVQLEFAAGLVADINDGLVIPWISAIRDIDGMLRMEARPAYGNSIATFWPGPSGVPDNLRPSRSEFLLEDVDKFPEMFRRLVHECVGADKTVGEAIDVAAQSVAEGGEDPQFPDLPGLCTYYKRWQPQDPNLNNGGLPAAAQISMHLNLDLLFRRAVAWLKDDQKPSGRYLRQSMADYLTDQSVGAAVRISRADRLKAQLRAALQASAPLASLDPGMLSAIYGQQSATSHLTMSALNVPDSEGQLRESLVNIAVQQGLQKDEISFTSTPRADAQIFQFTERGYHPMVYASVMGPLTDQWARARNDVSLRTDFWRWRRTRALSETVPLERATRVRLLRGWYVGRLIGYARVTVVDGQPVIQIRGEGGWRTLPKSGPRSISAASAPGNVLELVSLGIMDAYIAKHTEPLEPWRDLLILGSESAPMLSQWIGGGDVVRPDGAPILEGIAGGLDERGQSLIQLLHEVRNVAEQDAIPATDIGDVQKQVIAEIASEVLEAIDSLIDDVTRFVATTATGPGTVRR